MELLVLTGVVVVGLMALLWRSQQEADRDRDAYLRAVTLSMEYGKEERAQLQAQVSEMATRIQHPEMTRPDLHSVPEPGPPPEPDEAFDKVGKVYPDNGTPDEEA